MKYETVHIVYFSPTRTSAKIAGAIAKGTGIRAQVETDLTYEAPDSEIRIENALVIVAVPVYGGRVAETAMERLQTIEGNGSAVVPVVVYGNRDYEDALRELTDFTRNAGFIPVAAGTFIGEHSYSRPDLGMPLAAGRPDADDLAAAGSFGKAVAEKLAFVSSPEELPPLTVKGNFPYKVKGPSTPAAPVTKEELCTRCGHCMEICPTRAVAVNEAGEIASDKLLCIKCCACVKECPEEARLFDTPYTAMLFNNFKARRVPDTFI
ncbi:MAG: 4Fe-4S binding protein [Parabacteroides sp.]|nr:4Fe-4S binding protein [Parabacteroides sp.]